MLAACGASQPATNSNQATGDQASGNQSSQPVTDVRVAAINSTSSHYVYITQVANTISSQSKIQRWTIIETGGIDENHQLLKRGEADVAISAPSTLYQAVRGIEPFKEPNKDLRALWVWVLPPQTMIARADSGVKTLQDLSGKSVLPGGTGTSTDRIFRSVFSILGIEPEYRAGSLSDGVSYMQDGRIVAFGKASPGFVPDATYLQIQSSTDIIPVGFTDDEVAAVQKEMPYVPFITVPANTVIPDAPQFKTWVAPLMLVATSKMPEDVAYEAVKAAVEAQDTIAKAYKGTEGLDYIQQTIENAQLAGVPLHPGVERYFTEQGATIPDEIRAK